MSGHEESRMVTEREPVARCGAAYGGNADACIRASGHPDAHWNHWGTTWPGGGRATGHAPWCDTVLGPDFKVEPGVVRMTLHICAFFSCWRDEPRST